jgi:hypothetical protein
MYLQKALVRPLEEKERLMALRVFGATLPFERILLCNDSGPNDRPFTQAQLSRNFYFLHVGAKIFNDATSTAAWTRFHDGTVRERFCDVFIHELTHVWQGVYRPGGLLCRSTFHQLKHGNGLEVYVYDLGATWACYTVEQQAQIVEDWFNPRIGNESPSDARYRYIIENIRTRRAR